MKTSPSSKTGKSNRTAPIADLAPAKEQDVRGGREASVPAVSEITVTKTQDISTVNMWK